MEIPKITIPHLTIDWKLLAKQKKDLITLRSKLPSASKNYELFSGLIHLLDFLTDLHLDEISKIVLVQDCRKMTQYFINDPSQCHSEWEYFTYENVMRNRKTGKFDLSNMYPISMFSRNDWENLKKYGLNHPFELN